MGTATRQTELEMNNNEKPGCLGAVLRALGLEPKSTEREVLPYRIRDDFLSSAELNFYRVLRTAVGDWAVICPKVSLGDLFYAKTGDRSQNLRWKNKIDRKHVDFLLCDPGTMRPLLGIELDDTSHQQKKRQDRDIFVDQVFAAAGLPLQRVPVRASYNVRELSAVLRQRAGVNEGRAGSQASQASAARAEAVRSAVPGVDVKKQSGSVSASPSPRKDAPPSCPKCGQPMVLRVVKKEGPHKGKRFWGCRDFPRCRGVREYVPAGEE